MKRTVVYIDGFNLYHGMKAKGWEKYLWLDLAKFANALTPKGSTLIRVRYFTSRVSSTPTDLGKAQRQSAYIDAIRSLSPLVKLYEGNYQSHQSHCKHCDNKVNCHSCGAPHIKPNEKKTDVNLATSLFVDAIEDICDTQILVSGDGDYENALKELRKLFPRKDLIVAFPPMRKNNKLMDPTTQTGIMELTSDEHHFAQNQLADPFVFLIDGKEISIAKPSSWS